ncbi:MAG: Nicotinate phosphoribosyltransferase [uncultured Rubrobacteraceae bacterium]|uniref:Nicotinate phosphoribosyltransferase n=1 Tax=uncultured Rubrobacteraceae bacterium TaxID=349277 RepID=A0A6J4PYG3_9ACTN|nr:MAG: Nicotinate phosphoribosyltransferase [uncultured Rubrobacteraceae bacterium]
MAKKRTGAKAAAGAGKLAGGAALKAAKGQAKLARAAASPKEPAPSRFFKYGLFALAGLAIGALLSRSRGGSDSSFTGTTGQHAPDPASPAGQRGETWGSGTPTGTAGGANGGVASEPAAPQRPEDPNRTGAEREYSDPSGGPLIGEHHRGSVAGVGESQAEVEQRVRTRIGEDPRTAAMPRVNVEVIDGVAELRGPAPSQEVREAAGEIAADVEGVTEVRNLIVVS